MDAAQVNGTVDTSDAYADVGGNVDVITSANR